MFYHNNIKFNRLIKYSIRNAGNLYEFYNRKLDAKYTICITTYTNKKILLTRRKPAINVRGTHPSSSMCDLKKLSLTKLSSLWLTKELCKPHIRTNSGIYKPKLKLT